VDQALDTYRKAPEDKDLAGLLSLFGSTEKIVTKWKRVKDDVFGYDENNREIVKVPLLEAPTVRQAFDTARGVARSNVT
jgi:hypothetical protein